MPLFLPLVSQERDRKKDRLATILVHDVVLVGVGFGMALRILELFYILLEKVLKERSLQ